MLERWAVVLLEHVAADHSYFVEIRETLGGRKAGGGAAEKARKLWRADPLGFIRSLVIREHTDERAWRRGANIDHVVVGPGGVFTLNTKNLTGKVWVGPRSILHNGHRTDFLTKAAHEAKRASRLLTAALGRPVEVRGAVAILADSWTIKEKPTDVFVGSPRVVKDWIVRLPDGRTATDGTHRAPARRRGSLRPRRRARRAPAPFRRRGVPRLFPLPDVPTHARRPRLRQEPYGGQTQLAHADVSR